MSFATSSAAAAASDICANALSAEAKSVNEMAKGCMIEAVWIARERIRK